MAVALAGAASVLAPQAAFATPGQDQFIASSVGPARTTHDDYDVPTSVTIAQAALESAWGTSSLSTNDNNYFGFKCVSSGEPGPIATGCHAYPTTECTPTCHTVTAYFRVYASRTDSFRDYGRLLTTSSAYASALPFRHDPDAFIEHVAELYATDPDYADKVESIMSAHDLYQYDNMPAPTGRRNSGSVVYVPGNNYQVFGIKGQAGTSGGALYQNTWNATWGNWHSLGGNLGGSPAVTYHDNRYDVFAVNDGGTATTGSVFQRTYQNGAWGDWHSIGGEFNNQIGVAAIYENGKYHVFAVSPSGTLMQRVWNGNWGDWQNLGGVLLGTPAVTYTGGRFDVFGTGRNGEMYQKSYTPSAGWGDWHSLGGSFKPGRGAAAVVDSSGGYHIFGINAAGALQERNYHGSWGDWLNIGGNLTGTPSVTLHDGRYDVFAISPTGGYAMYQRSYANGSWDDWHSIAGDFS
ncbi:glucosaminidase domain-containing protein [Actinoplanes sp. NPDC051494]|uniref:glucosaminidase domain-containing protein n=1 Tax=Actinoplanes sp. NPDC051494 TaxID=3363907 RepID=UPI00379750E2